MLVEHLQCNERCLHPGALSPQAGIQVYNMKAILYDSCPVYEKARLCTITNGFPEYLQCTQNIQRKYSLIFDRLK